MLGSHSISRKLMTVMLITSGTVLLLMTAAIFSYEFVSFRRTMVEHAATLARVVAANSSAALAFDNRTDAGEVLAALTAEPQIDAAAIYDNTGALFATYPAGLDEGRLPPAPGPAAGHRFGSGELALYEPVMAGSRRVGTIYLQSNLGAMYERFAVSGSMLAGVLLLSFVAAIVLSARLQRYVSRPVLALADTAQIVTREHDYSIRATRFGDDELGRLTDSFNTMLAHVQEQDASLRLQSEQLRHEVAERARAEEEVRAFNATLERRVEQRTKEVEAINKELEAFSYSVSHDLRAPLRHVVGFVEMLEQDLGDEVPERARRYMATIRKASVEMGQLIDDLLKFSRMSRSEMRNDVVPLDALVRAIASHLESTAGPRTIEWLVEPLPLVVGDSGLLKQVFVNLLDNAVKYSRGRDPARITVGSLIGEQGELVLFVRDNGAGFDMRYAQKLFGVFQRLHRPEEFEGTGIGLATVQRIIVRHGGRIWYESAVGEGTTFYFTLERAAVPAPQETEA